MPDTFVAPTTFIRSTLRFAPEAEFVGMARAGEQLHARTNDPHVWLKPLQAVAAGWYEFALEASGGPKNPRLYFDFGQGPSETWSVPLQWSDSRRAYRGFAWLPSRTVGVRLDPSDTPSRFGIDALHIGPLPPELAQALAGPGLMWPGRAHRANLQVLFAERSHLSGASVRMEELDAIEGATIRFELMAVEQGDLRVLRTIELPAMQRGAAEHLYWEPVEDSRLRYFVLRATLVDARWYRAVARLMRDARPVYSTPEPYTSIPGGILFSPVMQCNLNCTHCISRFTRTKFQVASDRVWDAVAQVARHEQFIGLATDYSGDILFDEVRHHGCLSRIIAMDAAFRIDTNANYLDEAMTEKLLASRLYEINFSVDSMDAALYPKIRRGAIPLADVLRKIALFMERKRALGKELKTCMSFVLMRSNAATIKPAFEFAREHGIDVVSVVPVIAFTDDMVKELLVWDEAAYAALYEELTAEAARCGVSLGMQAPVRRWLDRDAHKPCEVAHGTAVILGNGDVLPCCVPGPALGNLNQQTLEEVWHGKAFREFRMRVNTPNPPPQCRNCPQSRVHNNKKAYAPVLYAHPEAMVLRRARETTAEAVEPPPIRESAFP